MLEKKVFQIRSKEDARSLAGEIKYDDKSFHYYSPLMGLSGCVVTIRWQSEQKGYSISSSGSGWCEEEESTFKKVVEHLWQERKFINAELRYAESV